MDPQKKILKWEMEGGMTMTLVLGIGVGRWFGGWGAGVLGFDVRRRLFQESLGFSFFVA